MTVQPDSIPAPSANAVDVRAVVKAFGVGDARTLALKGTDFSAREGELHLVVGPSGCGKTTLLSVVAGTLTWDEGQITVFGTRLNGMSSAQVTRFRRQHIGFIFQQFNLISTLNLIENVSVPLLLNGAGRREAEDRSAELLRKMGLAGRETKRPTQLSGGQQQRVAIARALVHQPRLLICDEPTSALDSTTGHQIMDLVSEVARAPGRCVIIVTHDPRTYRYADRITEMEDGRIKAVLEGEPLRQFQHAVH
jgi:putative ABC transport system ATP-binding protein